jgi:hypothetical protein
VAVALEEQLHGREVATIEHEKEVKSAIVAGREVATIEHAINIILIIPLSFLPLSRRCRFSVGETGMRHGVASRGAGKATITCEAAQARNFVCTK